MPLSKTRSPWIVSVEILQRLSLLVGLVLFFQGKGSHGVFILIIGAIPLLRLGLSASYRVDCGSRLRRFWSELEKFSAVHGRFVIPYRAVFIYTVLPILFLGLINGISISALDNFPTMATAASILTEGNAELSEMTQYKDHPEQVCKPGMVLPYWLRCTSTGVYSAYPLGMLTFAVPFAVVSKMVLGDIKVAANQWRLQKWTAAWVAGASVAMFFIIALHFVSVSTALMTTFLLTLGSAMLSTVSQGLWTQGGVLFGFLFALLLELRMAVQPTPRRKQVALTTVFQGACLALMFASRLSSVALIAPLGIWFFFRSPLRSILVAVFAIVFHAPLSIYYWKIYGNFFGPQMQMGQSIGFSTEPLSAFLGLIFSPSRGLLVYQPWLLLLLAFLSPKVRRWTSNLWKKSNLPLKGWQWMFASAILFHLVVISLWPCWWGGACWGSRLLAEIVPLLAFFVLFPIDYLAKSKQLGRQTIFTLMGLSFLLHVPFIYLFAGRWQDDPVKGKVYASEEVRLWDWTDPPFLYPVLRSRYLLSQ